MIKLKLGLLNKQVECNLYTFLLLKSFNLFVSLRGILNFLLRFQLLINKPEFMNKGWVYFFKGLFGKSLEVNLFIEELWFEDVQNFVRFLFAAHKNNFDVLIKFLSLYIDLKLPPRLVMQEFALLTKEYNKTADSVVFNNKISFENNQITDSISTILRLYLLQTEDSISTVLEAGRNKIESLDDIAHPYKFDKLELLPELLCLSKQFPNDSIKKRSVVFLHHCYYNFYYLAKALRKRGWDAISVSVESHTNPNYQFYHDEDVNLFHSDPNQFHRNLAAFYEVVKKKYKMIHFYGAGLTSIFPHNYGREMKVLPWDFLEFKRLGIKLGFSHSGCNDLISQSSFYKWSKGSCDRCLWKNQPAVCSDDINLKWGKVVTFICDLICAETDPQLDFKNGDKVFPDPLTFALDSEVWRPDLVIPEHLVIPKAQGEIVIFHGVGNYDIRTKENKDYKGTQAVMRAIDKLKSEGHNVRLEFVKDMQSKEIRFVQVQSDILIEQLNYGRYGATTREGMMLGKPTIVYLNKEKVNNDVSPCIADTPIISANENTIYDELLKLVVSSEKRKEIGKLSREHALKWWSSDALAEKFEIVYDALMKGKSPRKVAYELRKKY